MKTEIFYARKLYNGRVDVWDKVVKYCQRLNRKLIVDYNGQKMLVTDLNNYVADGKSYMAQRTDKYMKAGDMYSLYSFTWNPVEEKHEEAEISMDGRLKMLQAWKDMMKKKEVTK